MPNKGSKPGWVSLAVVALTAAAAIATAASGLGHGGSVAGADPTRCVVFKVNS
jgi:hypothetical protein